jgi:hypothetical protein
MVNNLRLFKFKPMFLKMSMDLQTALTLEALLAEGQ